MRPRPGPESGGPSRARGPRRILRQRRLHRVRGAASLATEPNIASGLAFPRVGAEPCTGSNRPGPDSPSDALGSIPSDPVSIAASSLRMSPNMFSVSTTSKSAGRDTSCIAALSTSMCSSGISWSSATRSTVFRQRREVSDVRLVHARHLPTGEPERHLGDALDLALAVDAGVVRGVAVETAVAEIDAAVSSRTTRRSVPSMRSRASGAGVEQRRARRTGRRLANRPSSLRSPRRPCSGRGASGSVVPLRPADGGQAASVARGAPRAPRP